MAPVAKPRAGQRPIELNLSKYESSLESMPDDASLGRLQDALEALLSERSHPMIVTLTKQQEQLRIAQNVINHELDVRKSQKSDSSSANEEFNRKRRRLNVSDRSANSSSVKDVADNDQGVFDTLNKDGKHSKSHLGGFEDSGDEIKSENLGYEDDEDADGEDDDREDEDGENVEDKETDDVDTYIKQEGEDSEEEDDDEDEEEEEDDEDVENVKDENSADSHLSATGDNSENSERRSTPEKSNSSKKSSPRERTASNKFVANPKSEFVGNQTIPVHAFSDFIGHENITDDEKAYERRLGVASYPKEDLSTLTAGPVPMEDYTRAKPSNQVQFSTYATFLEPYFRPFVDADIQFLSQPTVGGGVEAVNAKTGKKLSPYIIPPLGPHYHQTWAIQDAELSGSVVGESIQKSSDARVAQLKKLYDAAGSVNDLSDPNLESMSDNLGLGPLTERLIAAILPESQDVGADESDNSRVSGSNTTEKTAAAIPPAPMGSKTITDFVHLEERVRNEFRHVGVLDFGLMRKFERMKNDFKLACSRTDEFSDPSLTDIDWVNGAEDDEICRELRVLQTRLKAVSRRNAMYKSQLLPVVQDQLAWQEYYSILQDLDKQVDQAFMKRTKVPQVKQKKRKGSVGVDGESLASTPQPGVGTPDASKMIDHKPAIKALIDKRERWISKISPLFKPAYEMMREYEKPKFTKLEDEDVADEEDEE